ncbi:MAG TPA: DNA-directed RNA polymerase subunit omega [Ruminococcaceae bacterium]|jgi:DNA-directed RNA polymerase subunit omega|nr:DNA-directed RNA polymerase subunit omega [Oscillospiraceae bacterium]HCA30411.1 DNA-directed RNA polymerase subunit omega [Oscillospiraceae bacterium]
MLKPTDLDNIKGSHSRYAMVIAVAKRARQIASESEEKNIIMTEKPVSLAIDDFTNGAYKVLPMDE